MIQLTLKVKTEDLVPLLELVGLDNVVEMRQDSTLPPLSKKLPIPKKRKKRLQRVNRRALFKPGKKSLASMSGMEAAAMTRLANKNKAGQWADMRFHYGTVLDECEAMGKIWLASQLRRNNCIVECVEEGR